MGKSRDSKKKPRKSLRKQRKKKNKPSAIKNQVNPALLVSPGRIPGDRIQPGLNEYLFHSHIVTSFTTITGEVPLIL